MQEGRLGVRAQFPQLERASGPAVDQRIALLPVPELRVSYSPAPFLHHTSRQSCWDSERTGILSLEISALPADSSPPLIWGSSFANLKKPFIGHSERTGFPQIVLLLLQQDPQAALRKTLGWEPSLSPTVLLSIGVGRLLVI